MDKLCFANIQNTGMGLDKTLILWYNTLNSLTVWLWVVPMYFGITVFGDCTILVALFFGRFRMATHNHIFLPTNNRNDLSLTRCQRPRRWRKPNLRNQKTPIKSGFFRTFVVFVFCRFAFIRRFASSNLTRAKTHYPGDSGLLDGAGDFALVERAQATAAARSNFEVR